MQTLPRGALLLGERKIAVTPFEGKVRITGRLEVGERSTTPNPLWLGRIQAAAREYLRLDAVLQIEETWAGLRPVTPDGLPVIAVSPHHENLIVATGHAMLGLSLAPGTGQLGGRARQRSNAAVRYSSFWMEMVTMSRPKVFVTRVIRESGWNWSKRFAMRKSGRRNCRPTAPRCWRKCAAWRDFVPVD